MIESQPKVYAIANVVHKAGGIDSIRNAATTSARTHFSAAFFRPLGGNPKGEDPPSDPKSGDPKHYKGTITGFTSSSNVCCAAWNLGNPHLAKNVDAGGRCKFNHVCDQFVTDKGKGGRCMGNHRRKDCDYDPAKKCTKPVEA